MTFTEAMEHVDNNRAVFSASLCGTVVHMPRDNANVFVPRVTNRRPILPITPFYPSDESRAFTDYELSGVPAGAV